MQQRLFDLDTAIRRNFKTAKNRAGFPKFKSKKDQSDTFRIPQSNGDSKHIIPTKTQIKIPKIGWVKWNRYRKLEGRLVNITIKQEGDIWFCICLCELTGEINQKEISSVDQVIGLDMGLIDFTTTSNNVVIKTPKLYRKSQKKLKQKQRQITKSIKGSKNREKKRKKLHNIHLQIKNKRIDFTHKLSNQITNDYRLIGVEDLNIAAMKKRYGKSVSDQGWSMFVQQLEYKSFNKGGQTIKVDRFFPSSKICSKCGVKHEISLKERTYSCSSCGLVSPRDLNAAINIKNRVIDLLNKNTNGTLGIHACGDTSNGEIGRPISSHVSLKQEKRSAIGTETHFALAKE